MQEYTINVTKSNIYNEVSKLTHYTGAKATEDNGAYERVALTEAEMEMIDTYIEDAIVGIEEAMDESHKSTSETGGQISITLSLSNAWKTENGEPLTRSTEKYITNVCAAGWFGLAKTDLKERYDAAAAALLMDMRIKANEKARPQRPTIR